MAVSGKSRNFATEVEKRTYLIMTTIALDRETRNYWNYIKSANSRAKLTLITLLSSSLTNEQETVVIEDKQPLRVRRQQAMTDEQTELQMHGTPIPLTEESKTSMQDVISVNSGRLAKGMEKWL